MVLNFDQVRAELESKNLIYLDVRNREELMREGQVVGSVNIPCMLTCQNPFIQLY